MSTCKYCGKEYKKGWGKFCSRGCSVKESWKTRGLMAVKDLKVPRKMAKKAKAMEITLTLPEHGLELKIRGNGGMIGTLCLTKNGCAFLLPNHKKRPGEVEWSMFASLLSLPFSK